MAQPSESTKSAQTKPRCFIAMPITTSESQATKFGDADHWLHVMESLFVPAVESAGFVAVRPVAQGSHLIHANIIKQLGEADVVLCDMSDHNPNVFFELGVRTSLNLPIALVRDELTDLPFDTSGINTHSYRSHLRGWEMEAEKKALSKHIEDCVRSCAGENPLWRQFGLSIRAQEPSAQSSPLDAKVDLMMDRMATMQRQMDEQVAMTIVNSSRRNEIVHGSYRSTNTPSEMLADALKRNARQIPGYVDSVEMGPEEVLIVFDGSPDPKSLDRIRSLAETYGARFAVDLIDRTDRHGGSSSTTRE